MQVRVTYLSDQKKQPERVEQCNWNSITKKEHIKKIEIIDEITSLGDWAFSGCSSLQSITLPNSVTSLGLRAFEGCSSLKSITLPNSVTSLGLRAFSGCSSLQSITLPNSVTSLGSWAFYGCSSLKSITLPNSVTSLGGWAFEDCINLQSITLPNSVTSLGSWAFYGCSSLKSITLPNSVTSLGDGAFYGCSSLQSITLPNSVTSLGSWAFYGCSSFQSITLPNSVTSLGLRAFSGCSSLQSITLPNSVTSLGLRAFYGCSSLQSITLPNSVTSLGSWAFEGCSALALIVAPDALISDLENQIHQTDGSSLIISQNNHKKLDDYLLTSLNVSHGLDDPNKKLRNKSLVDSMNFEDKVFCYRAFILKEAHYQQNVFTEVAQSRSEEIHQFAKTYLMKDQAETSSLYSLCKYLNIGQLSAIRDGRLNKDLFEAMPTKIVDSIIMEAIALIEDDEPRKSAYLKTLFQSSSGLDYLRTPVNKSTYKNPILLDALLDQRRPDLSCRKRRYEHTTSAEIVVELIDSLQEQVQIEQPGSISNNNSALFAQGNRLKKNVVEPEQSSMNRHFLSIT